ncbi:MAG: hypothetical protein U0744_17340 [Gemmataceae bacterium]
MRAVRVMPNTPSLVLAAAPARPPILLVKPPRRTMWLYGSPLLNSVGKAIAVLEKMLDAVTGSAAACKMCSAAIEALSDGGGNIALRCGERVAAQNRSQRRLGMLLQTCLHLGIPGSGSSLPPRRHHHRGPARHGAHRRGECGDATLDGKFPGNDASLVLA